MTSKQSMTWLAAAVLGLVCASSAQAVLVAQWNFDDDTYNDQVGSLNGTTSGSTSIVTAGTNQLGNNLGKAMQTGSAFGTDYLAVGDLTSLGLTASWTITMWIKHDTLATDDPVNYEFWDSWVGSGANQGGVSGTIRRGNDGGNAGLIYASVEDLNDSNPDLMKPYPRVDDNVWHFVAIRHISSGSTVKIYLDGVESTDYETGSYIISALGGKNTRIGDGFNGLIDDVRVYNAALTVTLDANKTLIQGGLYDVWTANVAAEFHPGDANGDGIVNLADLQILGDNWQSSTASWAEADFTGDGNVNLADLQILGDNWGFGVSSDVSFDEALAGVAIPEPASLALLCLALPLALRRRGN